MKQTAYLGLKKPEGTDVVNIDDLNENSDIIDSEITKLKNGTNKVPTAVNAEKLGGQLPAYYAPAASVPSKISQLTNDSGFITAAPVQSVNGKTGTVSLGAADVGAETPTGAQTKVDTHANNTTTAHGATSAATANKIIIRDASGRAKVAAPSAADDIARKDTVDAVQANLTTHLADKAPHSTMADVTYYVNATTGNDANNGLTSGTAFKTINAAISNLPVFINHTVTINISIGSYNEDVFITGFLGKGALLINGYTSITDSYTVNSLMISKCSITVIIRGFKALRTTAEAFKVTNALNVVFNYCKCNNACGFAGVYIENAYAHIANSEISNRYAGIMAVRAIVYSENNVGTGNTYGLDAEMGATIAKGGTQPGGTTAEATVFGGVIR